MRTLADDVAVAFEAKLRAVVVPSLEAFPEKIDASLRPVVEAIQDMGASIGNDAKQEIQETVRERRALPADCSALRPAKALKSAFAQR
jgi:hypothetical protein